MGSVEHLLRELIRVPGPLIVLLFLYGDSFHYIIFSSSEGERSFCSIPSGAYVYNLYFADILISCTCVELEPGSADCFASDKV